MDASKVTTTELLNLPPSLLLLLYDFKSNGMFEFEVLHACEMLWLLCAPSQWKIYDDSQI